MSKALSRVRALVSEIDAIQAQGRKSSSSIPLMKAVVQEVAGQESAPTQDFKNVLPLHSAASESPATEHSAEGKVFIQLTGKIAIQLQLEHSDEIVEVRQKGETIEIRFTDGKAIHLPLKSVA